MFVFQVKEVPIDGDNGGGYSVGSLDKPTARLSQYARGKTGNMNPFTPGGEVSLPTLKHKHTKYVKDVDTHYRRSNALK